MIVHLSHLFFHYWEWWKHRNGVFIITENDENRNGVFQQIFKKSSLPYFRERHHHEFLPGWMKMPPPSIILRVSSMLVAHQTHCASLHGFAVMEAVSDHLRPLLPCSAVCKNFIITVWATDWGRGGREDVALGRKRRVTLLLEEARIVLYCLKQRRHRFRSFFRVVSKMLKEILFDGFYFYY